MESERGAGAHAHVVYGNNLFKTFVFCSSVSRTYIWLMVGWKTTQMIANHVTIIAHVEMISPDCNDLTKMD